MSIMDFIEASISSISSVITSIRWLVCFNSIDLAGITEPMESLACDSHISYVAAFRGCFKKIFEMGELTISDE